MLIRTLTLAVVAAGCSTALAMPNWENGEYTCVGGPKNETSKVRFQTRNEALFLTGDVDPGAMGIGNEGIPCVNDKQTVNNNGGTVSVVMTCDAQSLSVNVAVKAPQLNTDAQMGLKVTKISPKGISIGISIKGKADGQAFPAELASQTVTCTKL